MNTKPRVVFQFALAVLFVFGFGITACGDTVVWADSAVSGNWDDNAKWTGGTTPLTSDSASITGQDGVTVDLNGDRSITGLSLAGPQTGMFTLGDAGDALTLLDNAKVAVAERVTMNADLVFTNVASGPYISVASVNNADRNTYVFNGDIDFGAFVATNNNAVGLLQVSQSAQPSHSTFNGVLGGTFNASTTVLIALVPGGNGSVTLNGDNAFTLAGGCYVGMNVLTEHNWTLNLGHGNALGNSANGLRFNSSDTGLGTSVNKAAVVNLTQDGMVVPNKLWHRNASALKIRGAVAGHTTWAGKLTLGQNTHLDGVSVLPATFSAVAGNTTTISGEIYGTHTTGRAVPVIVEGDGIVRFTRAEGNTYVGGTTVAGGTLTVNNASGSGTGTGAVVVEDGGVLGGIGIVSGATTIEDGGTLAPGTNGVGTLTFAGDVTLQGALQTTAREDGGTTRAAVGGALDLTGATLLVAALPAEFANGVKALIVASYDSLTGEFADVQGTFWDIDYNYLGNKQVAILTPPPGSIICVR